MKNYSLKELLFVALAASFFTAFIVSPFSSSLMARTSLSDFWDNLGISRWLGFGTSTSTPSLLRDLNLGSSRTYTPTGYEAQIVGAAKSASPAVVSVVITKNVPIIEQYFVNPFGNDPFLQQFFGDQFQVPQYRQKGYQKQEVGGGSGFIISSSGLILTNKHVVSDTEAEYTVLMNDGKKYSARVLARDPIQDLAVMKIDAAGLPTIPLADSDQIQVGQTAIAIGNSLGEFKNTVNVGAVSGVGRTITASGGGISETLQDVIQTDASINPGNSGGPLLNLKGEVVGINTAIAQGAQSIGFAIPINKAKRDINDAITKGKIETPYIGIRYIVITPALKEEKNLPFDYGALVGKGADGEAAVVKDSPADKAGIKEGDIILEINSRKIDVDRQVASEIILYSVGDTVSVKIWRGGEIKTVNIVLTVRP